MPRLFALFLLLVLGPGQARTLTQGIWNDPAGYFEQGKSRTKELKPGLAWTEFEGRLEGRPIRGQLITADLSRPGLHPRALAGARFAAAKSGQYFLRSTMSQMAEDNRALAAINVSFFDISGTETPLGLALHDGLLLREPEPARPSLLFSADGRAAMADLDWQGKIILGRRSRPLGGVNKNALGGDEVVLYLPPWSRSPGTTARFSKDSKPLELVFKQKSFAPATRFDKPGGLTGILVERRDQRPGEAIPKGHFVLTATKSAAPFFRTIKSGDELEVQWQLSGAPEPLNRLPVREIVSAGPILVTAGKALSDSSSFWTNRHPRSAAGIGGDGRQLALVVIDGRSAESAGIGLEKLARFFVHLGAREAINFDGGGSSALAAKVRTKVQVLNRPSDSRERLVPTGLGICP